MMGFHLFMLMAGAVVMMIGLHNSFQISQFPASQKLRGHRTYQEVYATSALMVILGLGLFCAALRAMATF